MNENILPYVGRSLYKVNTLWEGRRYLVFRMRCALHKNGVRELLRFFDETPLRRELLTGTPAFFEQTTRAFFFKDSAWDERIKIVEEHIRILEELFKEELLRLIYVRKERLTLWRDSYLDKPLLMNLGFGAGLRKEGCLALTLFYEGMSLYQIMFWLARDKESGRPVIYVGALQGHLHSSEVIKGLTKAFFGYRTKNLIFYGLRSFARALGTEKIYAVTNEGYYAMNHIRSDRKLKTDFAAFWRECGGEQCEDKRFYAIPVPEYRKAMEELKPPKRLQHRRRFAKMDEIKAEVALSLAPYFKQMPPA